MVGFSHGDFEPVIVHHQATLAAELTQVHATRDGTVVGQIEEDPHASHAGDTGVVGGGDRSIRWPLLAEPTTVHQMDVVGVGDEFPLHAFGRQSLFAAVFGQPCGFGRVMDPVPAVNEGLELAVRHQVGIAANRRSKVDVSVQIEPEMPAVPFVVPGALHQLKQPLVDDASGRFGQRAGGVLCFLQGSQNAVASLGVDDARQVVRHVFCRFLGGFGLVHAGEVNAATAQVGPIAQQVGELVGFALPVLALTWHGQLDTDVQGGQLGVQSLHLGSVGRGVAAPRQRRTGSAEQMADRCVGRDHERLDHACRLVGPFDFHAQVIFAVETGAEFGVVEVKTNLTVLPRSGQGQHVVKRVGLEHVAVGDVVLDVNHGLVGVRLHDVVLFIKVHADDHGQAVHAGAQRTEVVGQFGWQHWQHGMRQIDRGGTCSGGTVQGGAGLHVVRHVGDGHPQRAPPVLVHEAHGIVEVLGVGRVDGHQRKMPQVGASRCHLVVARYLAQGVGVVNERCVVGAREGVAVLTASPLQTCVEEFSCRPPAGLHQQEGHRRFVVWKTEAGTDGGALARFADEVETLH